ncbi:MAG: AbrB/MazE/SpoVT family DNA-binding domain-containing protein [Candidatus Daviesbacteria bacterium]|nr:AbrB/MazE/SpoVT family DNA-binding domain-containing protein [Candidatus Daviesbacteria bacterium]
MYSLQYRKVEIPTMSNLISTNQEEWVRILGKGMVTIPKNWREELGLETGEIVKARKVGNKVIIEAQEPAPYRIFSDQEITEWLEEDKIPTKLASRVDEKIKSQIS